MIQMCIAQARTMSLGKKKQDRILSESYQRRLERVNWIGVILTEDWNKDDAILKLVGRELT